MFQILARPLSRHQKLQREFSLLDKVDLRKFSRTWKKKKKRSNNKHRKQFILISEQLMPFRYTQIFHNQSGNDHKGLHCDP